MRTITAPVVVTATDSRRLAEAEMLAAQLGLPFVAEADPADESCAALLQYSEQGLQLQQTARKRRPGPVWVDFVTGAAAHRRKYGGGSGQMIAKAVGIKGGVRPQVLDLTAGLGRDAFVLATLGCEVTLLERSPLIHALLADGLARAADDPEVADIVARMRLLPADSIDWLSRAEPDSQQVLYLDPMFPHSDKSALVKKEMSLFQAVVGEDSDDAPLLEAAWPVAEYRLVVKRPRKAPAIEGRPWSYQLIGKSTRYDIYTKKKLELGS
ncbi:class I SAM-dependent methyltransferase [Marinobacterium arenosum]|uniref:class I SAM-dependent methyltransferase n=1 Tax=Marinobacterium arenosum TaxID=2862496 RepID=UPI001C959096|nr:class I SAM-dependent methyltransferase [Marinobacterium arenosum]MBY4679002.1 class I SAM-dependent methyltransferase [Marinobacterium arenosum]